MNAHFRLALLLLAASVGTVRAAEWQVVLLKPRDCATCSYVEEMLKRLHANVSNNRKPFEGIFGISPDPEQQQALTAALKKARELLAESQGDGAV